MGGDDRTFRRCTRQQHFRGRLYAAGHSTCLRRTALRKTASKRRLQAVEHRVGIAGPNEAAGSLASMSSAVSSRRLLYVGWRCPWVVSSAPLMGGQQPKRRRSWLQAASGDDSNMLSAGYVYNLSKRTALYGFAGRIANDGAARLTVDELRPQPWRRARRLREFGITPSLLDGRTTDGTTLRAFCA